MGAVTLKDLAAKLGLSITTVSRALSGYSDVAESTRQRVLVAADEMGYVPDVNARRLQKGRTDTLGFVIPTHGPRFSDPFFSDFLSGIGNESSRHNYDLLVSTRPPDTLEERAAELVVMAVFRPGIFAEIAPVYAAEGERRPVLDLPFRAEDTPGAALPGQ